MIYSFHNPFEEGPRYEVIGGHLRRVLFALFDPMPFTGYHRTDNGPGVASGSLAGKIAVPLSARATRYPVQRAQRGQPTNRRAAWTSSLRGWR